MWRDMPTPVVTPSRATAATLTPTRIAIMLFARSIAMCLSTVSYWNRVQPINSIRSAICREAIDRWLSGSSVEATRLIAPVADDVLLATAVSTYVNSVKHDGPPCLLPREPERQRSLF